MYKHSGASGSYSHPADNGQVMKMLMSDYEVTLVNDNSEFSAFASLHSPRPSMLTRQSEQCPSILFSY